jgi:hypothetical protein
MQTGPTNLVNVPIGFTDFGQLNAFYEAEHIRPHFIGHADFAVKYLKIYCTYAHKYMPSLCL